MKKMFLPVVLFAFATAVFVTACEEQKKLSREEIVADFMFQYTNLTPQQVTDIVGANPLTFANSEKSPGYTLTLDDSTLLIVPEGAACMRLNDITLNVWRKDNNTLTFFAAVVDERTQRSTVFETWLCGDSYFNQALPPREFQRYISTGVIASSDVSGHRHKATKRLTGKVMQWSDELTLFGSYNYSASVPEGSLQTFCYPTDYYELDDRHWLYSRVEVEFSGEFVLDVIDLYTLKKIGVRLGFDAQDKFINQLYADTGVIRGQVAAFGAIGESNRKLLSAIPEFMRIPVEFPIIKGMRFLYRPLDLTKPMTLEEVKEVAVKTKAWKGAFEGQGKEKKMLEHSKLLDNRTFTVIFDDKTTWDYEIGEDFSMRFREGAGEWKSERYDAFEMDDQLVFFAHTTDSDCPMDGLQYAIDLKNGLVTCIRSTFDDEKNPRDPRQQWFFGIIKTDGITPSKHRHQFTDELLGRSYTWEYSDEVASQHYYTTTESFSFAIFQNSEVGVMGSFPCKYVKIRDGVYLMSWIEMRSQGIQGILLFNTKTMHDCGTCHGMTHDQTFEFNTFCAEARSAGKYN
ncbi:MAG: hypothetical protein LBC19_02990 [Tannerella sp.]|jgi:hypothetical protein|nr:hypothetical protein [Tannerella sp.]